VRVGVCQKEWLRDNVRFFPTLLFLEGIDIYRATRAKFWLGNKYSYLLAFRQPNVNNSIGYGEVWTLEPAPYIIIFYS